MDAPGQKPATFVERLARDGYATLPGGFAPDEIARVISALAQSLDSDRESVLRSQGQIYGSRDLLEVFPDVCMIARRPELRDLVVAVVGSRAGLVRALYFDKPPGRSWSLPWHRDRTIAVKDNKLPTTHFAKPTRKAGIPHVEAPDALLARMLTLRLHLDAMTADNGPLSVIPGSHNMREDSIAAAVELYVAAGDVLAMRPLLSHASRHSADETSGHRRVVHLEFAPDERLPDGYQWQWFEAVADRAVVAAR